MKRAKEDDWVWLDGQDLLALTGLFCLRRPATPPRCPVFAIDALNKGKKCLGLLWHVD